MTAGSRASQRYPNFVDRRGIVFHRDIIWKANLSWARWVNTQRYLKDTLSVERRKRLDRIGFVWNWRSGSKALQPF
jgi:hypothetical protein